jgi:isopenicillin-N N-acyltransferase like protein
MNGTISLAGSAHDVGREYGALIGPGLAARLERVRVQAGSKGLGDIDVRAKVPAFTELLAQVAPHWLEEIEGVAASTDIEPADLLAFNCLPDDFWDASSAGHECTSYLAIGGASATGESLLHKNRDERDWLQNVHVKQLEGTHRYLAGIDIGNFGIAQFVNEHGLCGANNTGSHIPASESIANGLGDCLVMRFIAERARCCEDALHLLEELIDREVCGGAGPNRGTIYLFADRDRGLIIENTSRHLAYEWIDDGLGIRSNHFVLPEARAWMAREPNANTALRYERASELIRPHEGSATSELFAHVSRDHTAGPDSICNDNREHFWMTLSAFTHTVRREHTDSLTVTWICNGHAHNACYFPMHLGVRENAADLVSGEHNAISFAAYEEQGSGDHLAAQQDAFETAARTRVAAVEQEARELLQDGNSEAARVLLTETDHSLADGAREAVTSASR